MLIDYVSWGSGGQENEATAVNASLWSSGNSVPLVAAGHSMEFCGQSGQYGVARWYENPSPNFGGSDNCLTPVTPTTGPDQGPVPVRRPDPPRPRPGAVRSHEPPSRIPPRRRPDSFPCLATRASCRPPHGRAPRARSQSSGPNHVPPSSPSCARADARPLACATSVAAARQIRVDLSGFSFTPSNVTLSRGDHVVWVWVGGTHSVFSGANAISDGLFGSGAAGSLRTFSWKSDRTSVLDYFCGFHGLSMVATLNVVASGASASLADFPHHGSPVQRRPATRGPRRDHEPRIDERPRQEVPPESRARRCRRSRSARARTSPCPRAGASCCTSGGRARTPRPTCSSISRRTAGRREFGRALRAEHADAGAHARVADRRLRRVGRVGPENKPPPRARSSGPRAPR